jgi:hypothetical protein
MVIALMTTLGIMSLYVATNLRTLAILRSDLRLTEQKHLKHWARWDNQPKQ